MKVYIICFDGETIAFPTAFLDKAQAEERLRIMQDDMDAEADRYQCKSYSQWYSVEELEVSQVEGQSRCHSVEELEMERPVKLSTEPMTLEEVYDL